MRNIPPPWTLTLDELMALVAYGQLVELAAKPRKLIGEPRRSGRRNTWSEEAQLRYEAVQNAKWLEWAQQGLTIS